MARARRQGPFQRTVARFGREGPQIVTRRGVETAVLVPIEEWRRLKAAATLDIEALLLAPNPRFENLIPPRRKFRRRVPVEFQ